MRQGGPKDREDRRGLLPRDSGTKGMSVQVHLGLQGRWSQQPDRPVRTWQGQLPWAWATCGLPRAPHSPPSTGSHACPQRLSSVHGGTRAHPSVKPRHQSPGPPLPCEGPRPPIDPLKSPAGGCSPRCPRAQATPDDTHVGQPSSSPVPITPAGTSSQETRGGIQAFAVCVDPPLPESVLKEKKISTCRRSGPCSPESPAGSPGSLDTSPSRRQARAPQGLLSPPAAPPATGLLARKDSF